MTHKEFYNWTKHYLGARLESEKIDITPIVEKLGEVNDKEDIQKQKPYMLGDTWSVNFDYQGMLEMGLEVKEDTPVNLLERLLESFEDVNYHREAKYLHLLIEAKQNKIDDYPIELLQKEWGEVIEHYIKKFKKECKETLKDIIK